VVLTPKQVRSLLGISLSHVYNLLRDTVDPMPHYKIGITYRIDEDELNDWLEKRHTL
jgi:excisionase family DNA binding protein